MLSQERVPEPKIQLKLQKTLILWFRFIEAKLTQDIAVARKNYGCRFNANICCKLFIYVSTNILFVTTY